MARYDGSIPPGGEGRVALRVNTRGYSGEMSKSASVFSNDPHRRIITLRLRAFIKVAIYISNERVILKGSPGESVASTVELRAERKKPLFIDPIAFDPDQKLSYRIETVEEGRNYRIHFKTEAVPPGNFHGFLKLKTNYEERPLIVIRIIGRFRN